MNQKGNGHVLSYCSLLAAEHLALVALLEVASILESNVLSSRNIELANFFLVSVFAVQCHFYSPCLLRMNFFQEVGREQAIEI